MNTYFAATELHINIKTSVLFEVFGFGVTNAMVTGFLSLVIFLGVFFYTVYKIKKGSYNRFVGFMQWAFEGMYSQVESVIPDKKIARRVAPLALTIFFYVLISYWMSVLPGLDSITYNGEPVLRSVAADMNFTFALSIIALILAQYYAFKQHGALGSLGRYFRNPIKNPIGAFEGILELIGEFSRYTALSLRLFGNAFAGEVLLLVMVVLTSYAAVVTLPIFIAFELFIGVIQAYIFFILTLIFLYLAIQSHDDHPATEHGSTGDGMMDSSK